MSKILFYQFQLLIQHYISYQLNNPSDINIQIYFLTPKFQSEFFNFSLHFFYLIFSRFKIYFIYSLQIIELTQYTFDENIHDNSIVEFYEEKNEICKNFSSTYEQLEKIFKNKLDFFKVNCNLNKNLCLQQKTKGFPTLKIFLENKEFRYVEPPYTLNLIVQWIEQIIIEGYEVHSEQYWENYAKERNFTSYFLLSEFRFKPEKLKEKFPEFNNEKFNYHFFLTPQKYEDLYAIRNRIKIRFDGNIENETEIQRFFDQNAVDFFPQLNKENYASIRRKNQIYLIGSFSNGRNFYDQEVKEFIWENPEKFVIFEDIQFASVDYIQYETFVRSYIDIDDEFDILQGIQMYFLFVNQYEANNYYYEKIYIEVDRDQQIEQQLVDFANQMIEEGRVGMSEYVKTMIQRQKEGKPTYIPGWLQNVPFEELEEQYREIPQQPQYKHYKDEL